MVSDVFTCYRNNSSGILCPIYTYGSGNDPHSILKYTDRVYLLVSHATMGCKCHSFHMRHFHHSLHKDRDRSHLLYRNKFIKSTVRINVKKILTNYTYVNVYCDCFHILKWWIPYILNNILRNVLQCFVLYIYSLQEQSTL